MNNISINPNTNEIIAIPNPLDDRENIDKFLKNNAGKKVVVVQGLGFVGAVMSLVCANALNANYAVIGVDLANESNYWKIDSINKGKFPIIASDSKIQEFFEISKCKQNFLATYDSYAYSKADFIIVDINLDVYKNSSFNGDLIDYDVDLSNFKKAIQVIGENCKNNALILVETTVPPGTCEKVVKPVIENCLIDRGLDLDKIMIGHSYERVMPGPNYIDSIQNFYRVYSGVNKYSADAVESFLKSIISTKKFPLTRLGNTNATEMAKVLENSYRAMNIAFITEWSRFAEDSSVNLYEVVEAIKMRPTHSNMMYPGIGVGGYCLTKDPLLASWAKLNHFRSEENLKQSENGVRVNDKMPLFAFNYLKKVFGLNSLKDIRILLLGVSYRSDVADTRYSPVEPLYNYCLKEGANISMHDPYVKFWEELKKEVDQDFSVLIENEFDIIILSTSHKEYKNQDFINLLLKKNSLMIYDTVGVFSENDLKKLKKNHVVKVLGRGDL